ncbi:MAG TPA: DUF2784 domain-containing protein [Vicinamibacterales bacterium]|nr:DUF2784 domain-containing protein [Vicinamibacterales bacterium]
MYGLLADALLVAHLAFVLFVTLGGLLVLKWRRLAWLHIPAAAWGATIEFAGWICPLTPLENDLRARAGQSGYEGDFIARYLMPVVYPDGLTRQDQLLLGSAALAINLAIYVWLLRQGGQRITDSGR